MRLKHLPFIGGLLFCAGSAWAVDTTKEVPVEGAGTAVSVSISTSAATQVMSTSYLSFRAGMKVSNRASNSAAMVCTMAATTPTEATSTWEIEIQAGENPWIPVGPNMKLYCLSLHSSAESLRAKEYRQ